MTTEQTNAIEYIRDQLALNDTPSSWTVEDRQRYNRALAEFEKANPDVFPSGISKVIDTIAAKPYDPTEDASFSFSMFGDEVLNNAKNASFSLFGSLRNALYIAVAAGAVYLLYKKFGTK